MTDELSTRWLLGLLVVGLAVRLGAMVAFEADRHGAATAHHEHASIAANLARGTGFRFNFFGPLERPVLTSQQAPLVPGLLAGFYLLFGIESRGAFLALLAVQAAVASLTVVGIACLGMRLTGSGSVGKWAGLLAAGYPPLIESALHIQALCWNLAWLVLLLLAATMYRQGQKRLGAAGIAGAGVGGLYTDPILAGPVGLLLGLLTLEELHRSKFGPLRPLAVAAMIAVGVAPWVVRNGQVHGRFVPIKDSFWYVFWQGNNHVSHGTDKLAVSGADAERLAATFDPLAANRLALEVRQRAVSVDSCLTPKFIAELQSLPSEIDRMDRFRTLALRQLADNPGRYLAMCAKRLRYWLWFDGTNPRSYLWHYRLVYLVLAGWAFGGIWIIRHDWRHWLPVVLTAVALTAVHVLVITSARFRVLLELLLLLPAGAAVQRFACFAGSFCFPETTGTVAKFSILRVSGRPIQHACTEGSVSAHPRPTVTQGSRNTGARLWVRSTGRDPAARGPVACAEPEMRLDAYGGSGSSRWSLRFWVCWPAHDEVPGRKRRR